MHAVHRGGKKADNEETERVEQSIAAQPEATIQRHHRKKSRLDKKKRKWKKGTKRRTRHCSERVTAKRKEKTGEGITNETCGKFAHATHYIHRDTRKGGTGLAVIWGINMLYTGTKGRSLLEPYGAPATTTTTPVVKIHYRALPGPDRPWTRCTLNIFALSAAGVLGLGYSGARRV